MKKILYISNIAGKEASTNFFGTAMNAAKSLNMDFYVAANRSASTEKQIALDEKKYGVHLLHADICRSPFSISNLRALRQIVRIIKEYDIDYIHCNTPVGGVLGRIAGKICGVKKVIYQAHGFHFYKGAPLKNWLIYYSIERFLARFTDAIITINNEDYERAQKFKLRNRGEVWLVPGVGINVEDYEPKDFNRELKRKTMGLSENDIAIISAGDLIERKNYKVSLEAIAKVNDTRIHYYICGKGPLHKELEDYARNLNIRSQVHFLGFRSDVKELMWASDIFLFTTLQEGLPRSLSEAMASGLPCIASKIRGNVDLIEDGVSGFLCNPMDSECFAKRILMLISDQKLKASLKEATKEEIYKFQDKTVAKMIKKIYETELFCNRSL